MIERVADFGNDKEAKWVWHYKQLIKKVILKLRCLRPDTKALWTLLVEDE